MKTLSRLFLMFVLIAFSSNALAAKRKAYKGTKIPQKQQFVKKKSQKSCR